jgi:hypothetical protein
VNDLNEIQAMYTDQLRRRVQLVHFQRTTEMRDRRNMPDWDKLSTYGQDDLLRSVVVLGETFAELELQNHFLH